MPISCSRQLLSSSTRICRKHTDTTFCRFPIQAIEPLGECRSNVELFRALALRLEFTEQCFSESVDEMIDSALESHDPWMDGMTRERLEHGHVRLNFSGQVAGERGQFAEPRSSGQPAGAVPTRLTDSTAFLPFAYGGFRTPSGKAEFYCCRSPAIGSRPCRGVHTSFGIAPRRSSSAPGIARPESRQLLEYYVHQFARGAGNGRTWNPGDLRGRRSASRDC